MIIGQREIESMKDKTDARDERNHLLKALSLTDTIVLVSLRAFIMTLEKRMRSANKIHQALNLKPSSKTSLQICRHIGSDALVPTHSVTLRGAPPSSVASSSAISFSAVPASSVSYNIGYGYFPANYIYRISHKAAQYGDVQTLNSTLAKRKTGVDLISNENGRKRTALMYGAAAGHGKVVEVLIKNWSAQVNIADENNWTALDHALNKAKQATGKQKENYDLISRFLFEHGAKANTFLAEYGKLVEGAQAQKLIHASREKALNAASSTVITRMIKTASTNPLPTSANTFLKKLKDRKLKSADTTLPKRLMHTYTSLHMPIMVDGAEYFSKAELNEERRLRHQQGMEDAGADYATVAKKLAELLKDTTCSGSTVVTFTEDDIKAALEEGIKRADSYVGELVRIANERGYDQGLKEGQASRADVQAAVAKIMVQYEKEKQLAIAQAIAHEQQRQEANVNSKVAAAIANSKSDWDAKKAEAILQAHTRGYKEGLTESAKNIKLAMQESLESYYATNTFFSKTLHASIDQAIQKNSLYEKLKSTFSFSKSKH